MQYCLFDFACIVTCTLCYFSCFFHRDPTIELDFFWFPFFVKTGKLKTLVLINIAKQ